MDYTGTGRTNYVTIIDVDGLKNSIAPFSIEIREHGERKGMYAFFDTFDQGWPDHGRDVEGNDIELDIGQMIMPFVAEGEVLVMMDCGSEGHRMSAAGPGMAAPRRCVRHGHDRPAFDL